MKIAYASPQGHADGYLFLLFYYFIVLYFYYHKIKKYFYTLKSIIMTKEISTTTANKVRDKLNSIKLRLEKMEEAKNAGARTNGIFHWNGRTQETQDQNKAVKLSNVTSIVLLISILGFLLTRREEYNKAAERMELNPYPVFQWSGYPIDAWESDIRSRINVITHQSEVEKLTKLRDELSKYVSEEDRVNQLLAQIED